MESEDEIWEDENCLEAYIIEDDVHLDSTDCGVSSEGKKLPDYAMKAYVESSINHTLPTQTPAYKRPRMALKRPVHSSPNKGDAGMASASAITSSTVEDGGCVYDTMCPPVKHVYPRVLALSLAKFNKTTPDGRFAKRMKVGGGDVCSITSFIVVNSDTERVTEDEVDAFTDKNDDAFCEYCNRVKMFEANIAQSVCASCGESKGYMVPDTSFREGVSIHTPYLYKRSNHFRDHLKRVQGRESTQIEAEVLERISHELSKTHTSEDLHNVTPSDIRKILKRLGLSRLYNHTTRIWCLTTDQEPLVLTQTQESELLHLFQMIQGPWERVRPANRSNMLSYSYLINKMAKILGYDEIAAHFKLLKSKDKCLFQDNLWKIICQEMGFKFERSV
jgi:Poxvirus Late Transcription Factor VLTF3 like